MAIEITKQKSGIRGQGPGARITGRKLRFLRPTPYTLYPAFTLIELLVVMAITSILLILVFKPIIDGFNLTSRAGTQIESQATARDLNRDLSSALGNSEFVFDNVQTPINLWLTTKGGTGNFYQPQTGTPYTVQSTSSMVEYVLPSRQGEQTPGGGATDPTTGLPANLSGNDVGFSLPLTPGRALGRIFIGLVRNNSVATGTPNANNGTPGNADKNLNGHPFTPYGNRWEDPAQVSGGQDNRYMLYRAEVTTFVPDPTSAAAPRPYVPNLALFHLRKNSDNSIDDNLADYRKNLTHIELHDPNFFYDASLAGGTGGKEWAAPGWRDLNGDGKVEVWENWKASSSSLMSQKADLVALDRDPDNNHILYYDPTVTKNAAEPDYKPVLRPLTRFEPSGIQNDPGVAATVDNAGNESPNAPSAVYTTQYSHWSTPYRVSIYRGATMGDDPLRRGDTTPAGQLEYYFANGDPSTGSTRIVHYTNVAPGSTPAAPGGLPDVGPGVQSDPTKIIFDPTNYVKPDFFAFTVDSRRGLVNFAFPATAMVHDTQNNPEPQRYSPADINAAITSPVLSRALFLRDLNTNPGYNAATAVSPLKQFETAYNQTYRVRIVPGSERIFGPDQRPGPHYGYRVQYTRVATNKVTSGASPIGKNEYQINYETSPAATSDDPRTKVGFIRFNSQEETSTLPNIGQANPGNAPLAEYQANPSVENPAAGLYQGGVSIYRPSGLPQLKANAQTGQNVAADIVEVYYSFQMNRPNDVVKVDYLTRELMNVTLEARLYDSSSSTPQVTTVTNRVKVRNLQR